MINIFYNQNVVPKLNLKVSVISVSALLIGWANEILKGPTNVNQSTPIPTDDLILFEPFKLES